jgi:Protein of unknown function with PCYCGC motif
MDAPARLADPDAMTATPPSDAESRRRFLRRSAGALLALAGVVRARPAGAEALAGSAVARGGAGAHPTPRPGIDASKVLTRDKLTEHPAAEPVFAMVRRIPQVVDGIHCHCGCADLPEFYSLLSCFEADGMAQHCVICQGEAKLAFRMHEQGKSLDEIRVAIDEQFSQ